MAQTGRYNRNRSKATVSADDKAAKTENKADHYIKAEKAPKVKTDWSKIDLSSRSADHLMIQYGGDSWTGRPDSVRTGGFSRHFNLYFMVDKPFKTNPHFSVGLGAGIGSSNIFFNNTNVDLKSTSSRLPFTNVDSANHFKKYKVTSIYLEAPVELRYYANPANPNKSWKAALGVKVGTLLKSYSKGKNLVNKNGTSIYGPTYVEKESNKRFFNGTMLAVTGRVGYGIFSVDAGYQVTPVLKDAVGPSMHKFSIGITISGL
ncbi:MAG: hypothetical protein NVS3B15_04090 [Sediminibacterium sp.]